MNILLLAPCLFSDRPTDGGTLMARAFLLSLVPRHKVFVVAFDGQAEAAPAAVAKAQMEAWASAVYVVPYPRSVAHKLRAMLRQVFLFETEAAFLDTPAFRAACKDALAAHAIDVVIASFSQMAQFVDLFSGYPTVMDTQDVFSVSKFRLAALPGPPFAKLARFIAWLKWVRFERRYYRRFDHLLVVTEQDRYGVSLFLPEAKSTLLPRLVDTTRPARPGAEPTFHIGFLGTFGHEPNVLSVKFLLEKIVPLVRARVPDLRVLIAGKDPPQHLLDIAPPGVEFAGFLPSVDEFYARIAVIAAPLVTGGGIKIKVVEGLLSGLPVVTTSIGAEGTGVVSGVHAFIADTPSALAEAVLRLLEDPALRSTTGDAGRAHALRLCSREEHDRLIDGVFQSITAATSRRPVP